MKSASELLSKHHILTLIYVFVYVNVYNNGLVSFRFHILDPSYSPGYPDFSDAT